MQNRCRWRHLRLILRQLTHSMQWEKAEIYPVSKNSEDSCQETETADEDRNCPNDGRNVSMGSIGNMPGCKKDKKQQVGHTHRAVCNKIITELFTKERICHGRFSLFCCFRRKKDRLYYGWQQCQAQQNIEGGCRKICCWNQSQEGSGEQCCSCIIGKAQTAKSRHLSEGIVHGSSPFLPE